MLTEDDCTSKYASETGKRRKRKNHFRRLISAAAAGLVAALTMSCITHIHDQTYSREALDLQEEGINLRVSLRYTQLHTHKSGLPYRLLLKWEVDPVLLDELYCDEISILWPDGNQIYPLIHTATLYQKGPKGIPTGQARERGRMTLGEEFAPAKFIPGDAMVVKMNLRAVRDGLSSLSQESVTMTAREHCWIGIILTGIPGFDITFYRKNEP